MTSFVICVLYVKMEDATVPAMLAQTSSCAMGLSPDVSTKTFLT